MAHIQTLSLFLISALLTISLAVNPVKKQIVPGNRPVHTRFFAQIPNYNGKPSKIVSMTNLGNDLYVCTSTSGGLIYRVTPDGAVQMWFDVATAMQMSTGRRMSMKNRVHGGLRSLAFHPDFWQNGLFYTAVMEERPQNRNDFAYFSRTNSKSKVADSVVIEWKHDLKTWRPNMYSYRQVIRIGMPVYDHPIRGIMFEGRNLFIAHGDGSEQSATAGGGQRNDGLGKILRINPLQQGSLPYTIPTDNPFIGNPRWKDELYAVGFRNPIHMCMSKDTRIGLIAVDVGRDNIDEINLVRPGMDYGWSTREGTFVHRQEGGLGLGYGISYLPGDDEKHGFVYPVVQVGHYNNQAGVRFIGQALTGSCPVENGSPLKDLMLYTNFPSNGDLFYSDIWEMSAARTQGKPERLGQARTMRPRIFFDHDNNSNTEPKEVRNLRDIIRMDPGHEQDGRADVRFGRGSRGEIYWSSKRNGKLYLITSSLPGANV